MARTVDTNADRILTVSLSLPPLAYSPHASVTFSALVRAWHQMACTGPRLSK